VRFTRKFTAFQRILGIVIGQLRKYIALILIAVVILLVSGGIYMILNPEEAIRGAFGIIEMRGRQSITEGLIVAFSYVLFLVGLLVIYRGASLGYNPRIAITYALLGVVLLIISFLLFYILILIKI